MANESRSICNLCKSEVEEDARFCPDCGSLFEDGETCDEHKDTPALAVCTVCHVALCHHCVLYQNAAAYCIKHHPGYIKGDNRPLSTLWLDYAETVEYNT